MGRRSRSNSHGEDEDGGGGGEVSLRSILFELRELRKDNQQQFSDIKRHMKRTDDRMDEAEGRIEETETALQTSITIIKQLTKRQAELEFKLIDQSARQRRENLRFFSIRENKGEGDMIGFLTDLLKTTLDIPEDMDVDIMRAHRALAPKPTDETKPRSIVVKFGNYLIKEEILRRAWQKKELLCDGVRFYVDHDYPPEILKKRAEYAEARKVLKTKKIKFHTPYPARMRVFYEDGTKLYQNATEATRDMVSRGYEVTIVKPQPSLGQEEIQRLTSWEKVGKRRDRGEDREPGGGRNHGEDRDTSGRRDRGEDREPDDRDSNGRRDREEDREPRVKNNQHRRGTDRR